MGTAESSGATKDGIRSGRSAIGEVDGIMRRRGFLVQRFVGLTPAIRAIILVSIGFYAALVGIDAHVTQSEAQKSIDFAARLTARHLSNVSLQDAPEALARVKEALDSNLAIRVIDRNGQILAGGTTTPILDFSGPAAALFTISSKRNIAGPLDNVTVAVARADVLVPVAQRAGLLLVIVGLTLFVVVKRSKDGAFSNTAHAMRRLLDSLPDGAAFWSRESGLVAANGKLLTQFLPGNGWRGPGINYGAFMQHLNVTGRLEPVCAESHKRHARLTTPGGQVFDIVEHVMSDGGMFMQIIDTSETSRLRGEVERLQDRMAEMAISLQTQRVRGDAASRSKTLFLGQLNHELRTPLNHIIGFADLLRHESYGPLGDSRYLGYASHIQQSGETLLASLARMLELAEFDSGQKVMARDLIRLNDLIDWAENRYSKQAQRAGIHFTCDRAQDMMLKGDAHCLRRLIGNILDNSLKFTPTGGSLTLAAWQAQDGVVLEITDTGIGISAERLDALNHAFALGTNDENGATKSGGGIAIARAIAELSGGQLQINSSPALGTTVAICLPAKPVIREALRVA